LKTCASNLIDNDINFNRVNLDLIFDLQTSAKFQCVKFSSFSSKSLKLNSSLNLVFNFTHNTECTASFLTILDTKYVSIINGCESNTIKFVPNLIYSCSVSCGSCSACTCSSYCSGTTKIDIQTSLNFKYPYVTEIDTIYINNP